MIRLIEARKYRCLNRIRQPLDRFHVLVGPNASGKSTFLDVVAFLGDLVSEGLESAIDARTLNFFDLVWQHSQVRLQLAVELEIPAKQREFLKEKIYDIVRYEVTIGLDQTQAISLLAENVLQRISDAGTQPAETTCFTKDAEPLDTGSSKAQILLSRVGKNTAEFSEPFMVVDSHFIPGILSSPPSRFQLKTCKSALSNLPFDESQFPVSSWLKGFLTEGIQRLVLNSQLMRRPSPPGRPRGFRPDGSNLAWVIQSLIDNHSERYEEWIRHVRTALPDLEGIRTVLREEDRHRYLKIRYKGGLEVPSWNVSDGTLRLLALTLVAYIPDPEGVFLIEEPENGIHPQAVETVFQSLSSVYEAQVLLATHSPLIVSLADPSQVLCFSKTAEGATEIFEGDKHPALRHWKGEVSLGTLFASGVLG